MEPNRMELHRLSIARLLAWAIIVCLLAPPLPAAARQAAPQQAAPQDATLSPEEAITAALAGVEIGPDDFRISYTGGDTQFDAFTPAVVYNPASNEYLVVWVGDDTTDSEQEVFGQRIDAASGAEVGENDFRISDMGPDGDPNFSAFNPAVTYNSTDNEYLVVWWADDTMDFEFEIYGQRLAADGTEIGGNDFRISDMGPDGNASFAAQTPAVAYNSTDNEYLVVWSGEETTNDELEIYGQRLAADGTELGTNDFRISDMGPNGDIVYSAVNPDVVYNSTDNEYLVVWWGDDNIFPLVNNEFEIFGQRLSATGVEMGANDFRISDMGPNSNTSYGGYFPSAAYDPNANQYLVAWRGDDVTVGEFEIYGQLLNANGGQVGTNDFRISQLGPDGNTGYVALQPNVTYNQVADEYLVVWSGNGLGLDYEIYGQRLTASGAETGENDFVLSNMGPDGNIFYLALFPKAAYNPVNHQYLVVWYGDTEGLTLVDDEFEIFGQLVEADGTETGENDFRISDMGGDTQFGAYDPKTAYNPAANQFLVVWTGQVWPTQEVEIFGQIVDAASGELVGVNFRISDMGPDGNSIPFGIDADVVYNSANNEFLVVWAGVDTLIHEMEIYGQILNASGNEIGTNDFRISVTGADGDADYDADAPRASYNSVDNEYLVVWDSDHSVNNEFEIYGQRLNANGVEVGVDDIRLTHMGPDGNTNYRGTNARVAHNPDDNQYLLVWTGNDTVPGENEIYGRLLDNTATPLGMNHFPVSTMGPDGDPSYDAFESQVVYNPVSSEYLVVWYGDDILNSKFEIYGQRLTSAGTEIGADDFAISASGPANDAAFYATHPAVAVNPTNGEYLVAWRSSAPPTAGELEMYIQRLDPSGGLLGEPSQLSEMGPPDDPLYFVDRNDLAYNPQDDLALAVWTGNDDRPPMIYSDIEVFGQLYGVRVDLGLSSGPVPAFTQPGADVTYTLTTTNSGPDIATSLKLTATLPVDVIYVSAAGPGWTCGEAAGIVTCEAGTLAPGDALELTLTVTAPDSEGALTIPVKVMSANTDLEPADNSLTLSSQVGDPAYPIYLPMALRP